MAWEIYSVGDLEFLVATIEATKAIFNEDGFRTLAYIGALLGFIWMLVKSISEGAREVNIGAFFVALLMFVMLFTYKTDVEVYDARNFTAPAPPPVIIDDVPIGLAATSSLVSQIGKTITDWFVREYTAPSASGQASAFALQVLFEMRQLGMGDGSMNWDPDGKIQKSLDNYVLDCVIPGTLLIDTATGNTAIDASALIPANNVWEEMHFNNQIYHTEVFTTSGSTPELQSCADAYNTIDSQWFASGGAGTAFRNRFLDEAAQNTCQGQNIACNEFFDRDSTTGELQLKPTTRNLVEEGVKAIIGIDVDLDRLLISRAVSGAIDRAGSTANVGEGDLLMSTVLSKASAAMTSGQALEQGMFERTMRPLMTFFEALMFIAAPFAAFALTLGAVGIGLLGKYLVFALWIQLWQPVLAAINMYIFMAASGSMKAMSDFRSGGSELSSLQNQPQLFDEVAHWVGTGSMLAASTPAITLMLIYGSAVTASSLASRIDAPKNSEVGMDTLEGKAKIGERNAGIDRNGAIATGIAQVQDQVRGGTVNLDSGVSSAQQNAERASSAWRAQASHAQGQAVNETFSALRGVAERQSTSTSSGVGDSWSSEFTDRLQSELGESAQLSEEQVDSMQTMVKAGAGLGFDTSKIGDGLTAGLNKDNEQKLKGMMSKGMGVFGAFLSAFSLKAHGSADINDAFTEAYSETQGIRAAAADVWSQGDSSGTSWEERAQASNETADIDQDAFQKAHDYADRYDESMAHVHQAEQTSENLEKFQGQGGFGYTIEAPAVLKAMADPSSQAMFAEHVRGMQAREDTPAYYDNIDPNNIKPNTHWNALQGAIQSGQMGDAASLLSMAGETPAANAINRVFDEDVNYTNMPLPTDSDGEPVISTGEVRHDGQAPPSPHQPRQLAEGSGIDPSSTSEPVQRTDNPDPSARAQGAASEHGVAEGVSKPEVRTEAPYEAGDLLDEARGRGAERGMDLKGPGSSREVHNFLTGEGSTLDRIDASIKSEQNRGDYHDDGMSDLFMGEGGSIPASDGTPSTDTPDRAPVQPMSTEEFAENAFSQPGGEVPGSDAEYSGYSSGNQESPIGPITMYDENGNRIGSSGGGDPSKKQ